MKKKWKFTKKAACKAARFLSLLITLFVLQWTCSIGLPGGILVGRPALSGPSPPTSSTTRLVKKEDKTILCLLKNRDRNRLFLSYL